MRQRLSDQQKVQGILNILAASPYPLSRNELGKRLGFKTGTPLAEQIDYLKDAFYITTWQDWAFGHSIERYSFTEENAAMLEHDTAYYKEQVEGKA